MMAKVIIASTFMQARLAAENLGLKGPEWRYCSSHRDLAGINDLSMVVVAQPPLGPIDSREIQINRELRRIKATHGGEWQTVST